MDIGKSFDIFPFVRFLAKRIPEFFIYIFFFYEMPENLVDSCSTENTSGISTPAISQADVFYRGKRESPL